jgi:hypothetical protein
MLDMSSSRCLVERRYVAARGTKADGGTLTLAGLFPCSGAVADLVAVSDPNERDRRSNICTLIFAGCLWPSH